MQWSDINLKEVQESALGRTLRPTLTTAACSRLRMTTIRLSSSMSAWTQCLFLPCPPRTVSVRSVPVSVCASHFWLWSHRRLHRQTPCQATVITEISGLPQSVYCYILYTYTQQSPLRSMDCHNLSTVISYIYIYSTA